MTRQKWGQNFLMDGNVCRRISDALGAGAEDAVLEIGPGRGALTRFLAERTRAFTAVELDRVLAAELREKYAAVPGVEIVNEDFLKWPLPGEGSFKVIGNLPYNAGTAIIQKILDWRHWSEAVVMVQKEVARRMVSPAGSGEYGILSLAVQAKAEAKILFDVKPGAFRPAPTVISTVLRLKPLASSRLTDEPAFFRVVHAAFGQRRKTLLNSLSHGLKAEKVLVEKALRQCGLSPEARAETVDLETFDKLSQLL